jgi:hypothetical protein
MEPMLSPDGPEYFEELRRILIKKAFERRDVWPDRELALAALKTRNRTSKWHPLVLDLYIVRLHSTCRKTCGACGLHDFIATEICTPPPSGLISPRISVQRCLARMHARSGGCKQNLTFVFTRWCSCPFQRPCTETSPAPRSQSPNSTWCANECQYTSFLDKSTISCMFFNFSLSCIPRVHQAIRTCLVVLERFTML